MLYALGIVGFIVVINVIVVVHELGHYLMARHYGMKVDQFFVGFGPRIWSFRRGETEYGVKWIFLGGYVKIAGMGIDEVVAPEDQDRTYPSKPPRQRAFTILAGPISHFLMAFIAAWIFYAFIGAPVLVPGRPVTISEILPDLNGAESPASEAGFKEGDVVIAVNGDPVVDDGFRDATQESVGEEMTVTVLRGRQEIDFVATPVMASGSDGARVARLGVILEPATVRDPVGAVAAVPDAASKIVELTKASVSGFARAFGPEGVGRVGALLFGDAERQQDDVMSSVGLAKAAGEGAERGDVDLLFTLFIAINVFVGLLNLLPLPPFDGGHLAVLGIEKVRKKPVDMRKLIPVSAVVLSFFLLYTSAVVFVDLFKPVPLPP